MYDLWRFFGDLAYKGSTEFVSGQPWSLLSSKVDDSVALPDPIDVAGKAKVSEIYDQAKHLGFTAVLKGIELVLNPNVVSDYRATMDETADESAKSARTPPMKKRRREAPLPGIPYPPVLVLTPNKYMLHFSLLCATEGSQDDKNRRQVMQRVSGSEKARIRFFNKYFSIPKPEKGCRTIFNGKRLSRHWVTPPTVNLADTRAFINKMKKTYRTHKKLYVYGGDFRHWFHQISVNDELQRYFGLAMKTEEKVEYYRWNRLPMGWSLSPWIAQSLAWAVICGRKTNQTPIFDESLLKGDHLPTFVGTKQGGFATVYYDNFIIVTPCKKEYEVFRRRMESVSSEQSLNLVSIKEGSVFSRTPSEMHQVGFDYVGIHFQTTRRSLQWHPAKLNEWKTEKPMENFDTPKKAAHFTGRLLFYIQMNLLPLICTEDGRLLSECMSEIGKAASAGGWEEPFMPSDRFKSGVGSLWEKAINSDVNPFSYDGTALVAYHHVLATDASKAGYGYQAFSLNSGKLHPLPLEKTGSFTKEQLEWHIYEKELFAAVEAIKEFFAAYPNTNKVALVTDNSAVAWGLYHGYTNHRRGMERIKEIEKWLPALEVVLIPGTQNPTDCHSRAQDVRSSNWRTRVGLLETTIERHEHGLRCGTKNSYTKDPSDTRSVRHQPPSDQSLLTVESAKSDSDGEEE